MAGYTPKYGPPGTEPEYIGSRNRRDRRRRASSPKRFTDRQLSAEYDTYNPKQTQTPKVGRKRNNLAAQIRSLEKLLQHPSSRMPADVRQEKGRELASLVLERERKKSQQRATKNLGKYHMVRFVERQKCERKLKQLRKMLTVEQDSRRRRIREVEEGLCKQESDSDMDTDVGAILPDPKELQLERQIKQTEIDLNYTIYAPLGEKYISLLPSTGNEKMSGMSGVSKSVLTPDEEAEVRRLKDDNILRNNTGERPPMWYQVEECMQKGTLEQLRDGKLTVAPVTLAQVGGKEEVLQRAADTPNWLEDDGSIAAEDLDSEDYSEDDSTKSDAAGGFFE